MDFHTIVEYLQSQFNIQLIRDRSNGSIDDIYLLDGKISSYKDNVLYIGFHCQNSLPRHAILCGYQGPSHEGTSLALVKEEDLFSVFNACHLFLKRAPMTGKLQALKELAQKTHSLGSFIEEAAKIFNNPLVLVDSEYRVLAHSEAFPIKDTLWATITGRGYGSFDAIKFIEGKTGSRPRFRDRKAHLGTRCFRSPSEKIYCHVHLNRHRGLLLLFGEEQKIEEADYDLLSTAGLLLEKRMPQWTMQTIPEVSPTNILFHRLLIGAPAEELDLSILDRTCKNSDFFYLLAIKPIQDQPLGGHTLASLKSALPVKAWDELNGQYLFLLVVSDLSFPGELRVILKNMAREEKMTFSLSQSFKEVAHAEKAYRECLFNLDLPLENSLILYSQTNFLRLLLDLETHSGGSISWKNYIHPSLLALITYDKEHKSSLVESLRVFLRTSLSIRKTAEQLFLHRNSVHYRLKQIIAMTGIDFNDDELIISLKVSFLIVRALELGLIGRPPSLNGDDSPRL